MPDDPIAWMAETTGADPEMVAAMHWAAELHSKPIHEQYRILADELHTDLVPYLCKSPLGGVALKHPLYWSPLTLQETPARINNAYLTVLEHQREYIAKGDWSIPAMLVAAPYRFEWVLDHRPQMTEADFRAELASAWMHTEYTHQIPKRLAVAAFRSAGWMTDVANGNVNDPLAPPRPSMTITLYRGVSAQNHARGLSWTAEPERAVWFAKRWADGEGHVYQAEVEPDRLLAYFGRRGEAEYVIDTTRLAMKLVQ